MLLATIIPYGSSILITYYYTKSSLEDQLIEESSNLLYQGRTNLENYLQDLSDLTLSVYNYPDFLNYMRSSSNDQQVNIGGVRNIVQAILNTEDTIEGVYVTFANDQRVVQATKHSTVVFTNRNHDLVQNSFNRAQLDPHNIYIEPTNNYPAYFRPGSSDLLFHRVLRNVPSDRVLAYMTLQISRERIEELSMNLYQKDAEDLYLVTREGEVVYSSTPKEEKQEWKQKILPQEEPFGAIGWKDDSFNGVILYTKLSAKTGGWYLIKRVPYDNLYESAYSVIKINILFGILGLSLVILATLFISFKITSPIRVLLQTIEQVENGNLRVKLPSFGSDEIGLLSHRFQQMMERVNKLIIREYKLELENKNNQLKVLQSQINPHFLFNALQSIGTIALKNRVPQIYSLITHLSNIMRYSMNVEEDLVPLHKEVKYTEAFMELQKERFGDHLHYKVKVEESIKETLVPKMIIQPHVENFFKHGFSLRESKGEIHIECKESNGYLLMIIRDNGIGVTKERLEEIQKILQDKKMTISDQHIGLKNVYARLTLYYGPDAQVYLRNIEPSGFEVIMTIPLEMSGD